MTPRFLSAAALALTAPLAQAATPSPAVTAAPAKKPPAPAPKDAADRFTLDLPATDEAPPETAPDAKAGRFTLDTPIAQLLTDYRSKAVLDKDMPGLSTDKNLDTFKPLSLNRLAPMSGGRLTPELLAKVGRHLSEIK